MTDISIDDQNTTATAEAIAIRTKALAAVHERTGPHDVFVSRLVEASYKLRDVQQEITRITGMTDSADVTKYLHERGLSVTRFRTDMTDLSHRLGRLLGNLNATTFGPLHACPDPAPKLGVGEVDPCSPFFGDAPIEHRPPMTNTRRPATTLLAGPPPGSEI